MLYTKYQGSSRFLQEDFQDFPIYEGDTPLSPCVLRTALFWPCVLRTAIFRPRVLRTV